MGGGGSSALDIPGGGSDGYHVLRVQPNSPGHRAGIDPFFDYIVAVEGSRLVGNREREREGKEEIDR